MKIKKLEIINFKRFDNLIIDLGDNKYKLVVLIGPNGCGKSSVFDSFEQVGNRTKKAFAPDATYLQKKTGIPYKITIDTDKRKYINGGEVPDNFCYLRSSYRIESDFKIDSITRKSEILKDEMRPPRMIDIDRRVRDNYERLVSGTVKNVYSKEKDHLSVSQLREELIGKVRESMLRIFPELILEGIGDPLEDGQFYFKKGRTENFLYKNLSGGEKGAFDILFDLIIKIQKFNDTIIAIDEPDLHMHSSLQQGLLKEIYYIIPDTCQLWIATHSIGFIQGACELVRADQDSVAMLDFADKDYDNAQIIAPIKINAKTLRKIFKTAIDDLSKMVTPSTIIICEGTLQPDTRPEKKELDTKIYNQIFADQDILFISGDCKATAQKSSSLLFKIVKEAGSLKNIFCLADRDNLKEEEIQKYQSINSDQKFLKRRTIENYLFDDEILRIYCQDNNIDFNPINTKPKDIINDDLGPIQGAIKNQCNFQNSVDEFKFKLSKYITPDTNIYKELKECTGI